MNILSVNNLTYQVPLNSKSNGDSNTRTLLDDVSFTIEQGTINTIIGENGAGKSSLLKIISGDISVNTDNKTSEILFNNTSLLTAKVEHFARSFAVLPQFSILNFPFLCKEVVALGRTPHASGTQIDQQIIDECLAMVDMQEFADSNYMLLSGGEKQRIQIARVLAQIWRSEDSDVSRLLLLDEPCQSLDLSHQIALMNALKNLADSGLTVLMVLHDISLAARFSDKLIAMKRGKIEFQGEPSSTLSAEKIESLLNVRGELIRAENNKILGWLPS